MFKKINVLASFLLIVGGLNWGLVGFFDFNFIDYFICQDWLDRFIYVLIGFAALYYLIGWKEIRKHSK